MLAARVTDLDRRSPVTAGRQSKLDPFKSLRAVDPLTKCTHAAVDLVAVDQVFRQPGAMLDEPAVAPIVHRTFGVRAFDHDLLSPGEIFDDMLVTLRIAECEAM